MGRASPRAGLCRRLPPTLAALVLDVLAGGHRPRPASKPAKPFALLNTRVVHCGDNLEQLAKLPDACVDLIYCLLALIRDAKQPAPDVPNCAANYL